MRVLKISRSLWRTVMYISCRVLRGHGVCRRPVGVEIAVLYYPWTSSVPNIVKPVFGNLSCLDKRSISSPHFLCLKTISPETVRPLFGRRCVFFYEFRSRRFLQHALFYTSKYPNHSSRLWRLSIYTAQKSVVVTRSTGIRWCTIFTNTQRDVPTVA